MDVCHSIKAVLKQIKSEGYDIDISNREETMYCQSVNYDRFFRAENWADASCAAVSKILSSSS